MARILVVDDDDSVRELIKDLLVMNGHAVDTAADGLQALAAARQAAYDLVVLDRTMPKADGIMTLAALRADAKLKTVKVLMCTSASVNKEIEEAFQAGADDYILKPINIPALLAKVAKLLGPA